MQLSTPKQEKGLKTLMRLTAVKPINKRVACRQLTRGEEPIYSRSRDASQFIKNVIDSDTYPLDVENGKIIRKDIDQGGLN
jgi:glucose dehydrogenase